MTMAVDALWQPDVQQAVYRQLLAAMAYPGTVRALAPAGGAPALRQVAATLCDGSVTLADPQRLLPEADLAFLQARQAPPEVAMLVIADGTQAPACEPCRGELLAPERGATVLVQVPALAERPTDGPARRLTLRGPGIRGRQRLEVGRLHAGWLEARTRWNARFPLGVDVVLCAPFGIAALPRTTVHALED